MLTRTFVRPLRVSTKSGSTPNWVIVGPRLISTTWTGAPKEASVSSIKRARCWMNSSLTEGAVPESRICFTSGNCQLITVSAGLTVFTGSAGSLSFARPVRGGAKV